MKEGSKTYRYGYLDKVLSVREGRKRRTFTYHADGQLATAPRTGGPRSVAADALFTGKPHVDGLGYAFLFRNYRPGLGKWQAADPLGYPDGWNRLAYCGNDATLCIDIIGASAFDIFMGDDQGIELLDWWLFWTGTYFFRGEYSDWANYMRANKMLATMYIYKTILTYDLYETWNDVIDPNENYWIDRFLSEGLSFLYSPKDFQVKLKWYRQWVFEFGRPE